MTTYFDVLEAAETGTYTEMRAKADDFQLHFWARYLKTRFQESTHTVNDIKRLITDEFHLPPPL